MWRGELLLLGICLGVLSFLLLRASGVWTPPRPYHSLTFVAIGPVDPIILRAIAQNTGQAYALPSRILPTVLPVPSTAYNASRRQYAATPMRDYLKAQVPTKEAYVIGVTNADLYTKGLNFVFGEAELPGRAAVMSLARLGPLAPEQTAKRELLIARGTKIAIHELGHDMGLPHCQTDICVMRFCNTARELDNDGDRFCARCQHRLR